MGSREDISKPNMNISNGASALAASPSPIPPSIGSNMAQACWNSVLARRRPALQRHTWQAGHSVCCVWGIYQKKRRLQLLPSSFPSSLVSSAFLPPCLLPFVRVGSVRLARSGFDVWLPFSVRRGTLHGLPYDCVPKMLCSKCRSPAPQAPARGEGAPSVIRLLAIVAH